VPQICASATTGMFFHMQRMYQYIRAVLTNGETEKATYRTFLILKGKMKVIATISERKYSIC
jgi:hypothetical protein